MEEKNNQFNVDISKGLANPECVFKGNKFRITILSDVLIRFEYNEEGKFNDYPTLLAINRKFAKVPKFSVKQDDRFLNISNSYFVLEYAKEKPFTSSKLMPDANLRVSLINTDKVWYVNHPEVRNFKGTSYSLDLDKGHLKLWKGLYSTDGFASIDDTARPVFISDGSVKKNPSDGLDIYLFIYRKDFGLALQSYFELTGYPTLIPRYALGVWWNKNEAYKSQDILDLVQKFDKNNMPISSVILGPSWHKTKDEKGNKINTAFTFDNELISNPKDLIDRLHRENVFVGININTKDGINPRENAYPEIAKELNQTKNEIIPINVYNDKIVKLYYEKLIKPLNDLGVDLLWLDEDTKDMTSLFMINHYSFMHCKQVSGKRSVILSRNPGIAAHRYPVLYSGDTLVSWKTLKLLPHYNSSSSNIGVSWWSHDIGGYKNGTEDEELYARYVQLGTYSPIFRFAADTGRYYKREPWKWDVKTQKIVKDYMNVRYRLIPYIYTEAYKYSKTGSPLIQPLYYKYPELYDEPIYKNEYFFGSELFVSPITEPKDTVMKRVVHRIFLPNGMWYDFKTGKKFPGGKRYVTFFKDEDYPVFAKSGSIIPMAILDSDHLNGSRPPRKLEIQVFPGRSNAYRLYEDDGVSNLYEEGYYIITNIDYNYRENNYTLIIRPIDGKSGLIPDKRDYKIRFRNTKYAEDVKVNVGRHEVEFEKYIDDADFIIEVKDVPTIQQLTINCAGKDIEIDAVRLINEEIDSIISDLKIETQLKEKIANIVFSDMSIRKKRIEIRKLRKDGLKSLFVRMFIKLLEYIAEI